MKTQSKAGILMMGLLASSAQADATPSNKSKESPVNFVVICLDDMGYGDLTQTGAIGYATPNIDRMAKEGAFLPITTPPRRFVRHRGLDY